VGPGVSFTLPADVLSGLIGRVAHAVSDDDTRPALTGINLKITEDGYLHLAATDTHRLAWTQYVFDAGARPAGPTDVILPARALAEVRAGLVGSEPVTLTVGANQLGVRTSRLTLLSRIIEGKFPLYQRVIPSSHTRQLIVDREHLQRLVRRVNLVARDAAAKDRVVLQFPEDGADSLTLSSEGDSGTAREELLAQLEGEPTCLALNGKYLFQALEAVGTSEVRLQCTEPLAPIVLRPVGDETHLVVVMPMQVQ
jgi:DNA polymerase-3 subunit beta